MSELHKAVYREQRTIMKYDEGRVMLYPNETVIENYQPEKQEGAENAPAPFKAYQYETAAIFASARTSPTCMTWPTPSCARSMS